MGCQQNTDFCCERSVSLCPSYTFYTATSPQFPRGRTRVTETYLICVSAHVETALLNSLALTLHWYNLDSYDWLTLHLRDGVSEGPGLKTGIRSRLAFKKINVSTKVFTVLRFLLLYLEYWRSSTVLYWARIYSTVLNLGQDVSGSREEVHVDDQLLSCRRVVSLKTHQRSEVRCVCTGPSIFVRTFTFRVVFYHCLCSVALVMFRIRFKLESGSGLEWG